MTTPTTTPPGCKLPEDGRLLFSLTVPIAHDTGQPVERDMIYYTTGTGTNTVLFRCGPDIQETGRLDLERRKFNPARLLSGIPLSAVTDANQVSVTICNYTSPACTVICKVRSRALRTSRRPSRPCAG